MGRAVTLTMRTAAPPPHGRDVYHTIERLLEVLEEVLPAPPPALRRDQPERGAVRALGVGLGRVALLEHAGEDDRPASFAYIQTAIIEPNCATASCHTGSTAQAGIKLHTKEASYSILTGRPCDGETSGGVAPRNFVAPGQPDRSRLMYLLLGLEVRQAMPPDRPLPGPDIDLIERWILEGARCN